MLQTYYIACHAEKTHYSAALFNWSFNLIGPLLCVCPNQAKPNVCLSNTSVVLTEPHSYSSIMGGDDEQFIKRFVKKVLLVAEEESERLNKESTLK